MIVIASFILIVFSIVWGLVWFWFFKNDKISGEKLYVDSQKFFGSGNFQKAKELLMQIPDLDSNQDAKFKLATACLNIGEYVEAQNYFSQILKTSPKNIDVLNNLAKVLQLQGKDAEAVDVYTKLLNENVKDVDSYLALAKIYKDQGQDEKVSEILEKAKSVVPDSAKILFAIIKNNSASSEELDDYTQLISEYTDLLNKPDLPEEFHISLATVYAKNGQIEESLAYCKKAIEANDSDIEAYRLLGLIQLIKNDIVAAKNSLSVALSLQSGSVETHNIFSYLLCDQDQDCEREICRKKYYKLIEKYIK